MALTRIFLSASLAKVVNGNCDEAPYLFCCGVGTACDCSKSIIASGQCDSAAYSYCCMVGTKCDCDTPPLRADNSTFPGIPSQSPCRGCPSEEVSADNKVVGFFAKQYNELRSQAQTLASQQGMNAYIPEFFPIRYSTQVVGGRNWFVKVQIQRDVDTFADVGIFEHWDSEQGPPQIFGIEFGVDRDAPINKFGHGNVEV